MCDIFRELNDMVLNISFMPIKSDHEVQEELKECIKDERYEDACLLRDGNIVEYQLRYDKANFIYRVEKPNEEDIK